MPEPRRHRKSRHYDDYSDSDDDYYYSEPSRHSRHRTADRDSNDRREKSYHSSRDTHPDRRRSRSLDRSYSSRSRHNRSRHGDHDYGSRSRSDDGTYANKKMERAVKAAFDAGALEAFRLRKEPGRWTGSKGARIATAAIGAAVTEQMIDKNPDRKKKKMLTTSTIGGLIANRILNGPRDDLRRR